MSLWSWFNDAFDAGAAMTEPSVTPIRLAFEAATRKALGQVAPSHDEFEAWRDDGVTKFVMAALLRNADECREEWVRQSWNTGEADQATLIGLRERADALLGFTADYEAFCETLGLEPEQEEAA
jgi:hypothetical protein